MLPLSGKKFWKGAGGMGGGGGGGREEKSGNFVVGLGIWKDLDRRIWKLMAITVFRKYIYSVQGESMHFLET